MTLGALCAPFAAQGRSHKQRRERLPLWGRFAPRWAARQPQLRNLRYFLRTFKVQLTNPASSKHPAIAIILPAQTFNFAESYTDATSMYARTTFLAPTILVSVALGIAPA